SSQLLDFRVGLLAIRNIPIIHHDGLNLRLVKQVLGRAFGPAPGTVPMPDATFDPHHVAVLVRQPSQETNGGLYIFRMDQVEKPSADKFLVAITDNSFGRW